MEFLNTSSKYAMISHPNTDSIREKGLEHHVKWIQNLLIEFAYSKWLAGQTDISETNSDHEATFFHFAGKPLLNNKN